MIFKNKKNIEALFFDGKSIVRVYYGNTLVFELKGGVFGKGFWINNNPWINNEGWKNDK